MRFYGRFARVRFDKVGILTASFIEGRLLQVGEEFSIETPGITSRYDEDRGQWYFDLEGGLPSDSHVKDLLIRATNRDGRTFVGYGDRVKGDGEEYAGVTQGLAGI